MCAAPGGKTTAIAILMRDEGEVVALDRSHAKVRSGEEGRQVGLDLDLTGGTLRVVQVLGIASLALEMGLTCVRPLNMNALDAVATGGEQREEEGRCVATLSPPPCGKPAHPTPHPDPRPKDQNGRFLSRAAERKETRRRQNGEREGRGQTAGFLPGSFHRVLLDAPCSALGLRPRLFAGEVRCGGGRT